MSKKDMVRKRFKIINELKSELGGLKEHRKVILEEDEEYQELKKKNKSVRSEARAKKKGILETPEYKVIDDQMKELRAEIRDLREVLSQELVELYKEEGITEIEDSEGKLKKLKFTVRLVNA